MPKSSTIQPHLEKDEQLQLVRSERNLHQLIGLFATSQFKGRSRKIIRMTKDGKVEITVGIQLDEQLREVEIGVLRVPAYKVLEALIRIWELRGKPDKDTWIVSSRYELASILGRGWSGKDLRLLKKYLRNLAEIPIRWKRFYLRKGGFIDILEPHPLRFIQLAFLTEKRGGKEVDWRFKFRFDERFHANLSLGYTKPVLLNVVAPLSDTATLFYVHLDLVMADKNVYVRRSEALFRDLGLMEAKRNKKLSRRKEIIEKVIQELISNPKAQGRLGTPLSTGILTSVHMAFTKDRRDFNVFFRKKPYQKARPIKSKEEVLQLVQEMEKVLGVGERNRRFYIKIARRCPSDLIQTALRDALDEERAGKITGSKARFFGYWIQALAFQRGIDLGLRSSFDYLSSPSERKLA